MEITCEENTLGTILECALTGFEVKKFSDFNSKKVKCKIRRVHFKSHQSLRKVGEELSAFRRATGNYSKI